MPNTVRTPEDSTKPLGRILRGVARQSLELVRPLTQRDRDAKRGAWDRCAEQHWSAVERDPTAHAVDAVNAGLRRYLVQFNRTVVAYGSPEQRARALEYLADLLP